MKWLTTGLLVIAALLAGLLLFGRANAEPQFGTALDVPKVLPDVTLTNAEGQSQNLRDSNGKMRLVFYGFVRCPDVCPATLNVLKRTYDELTPEQQQKLNVQMISVDPEHDRPNVLREYLNKFDPAFTGLTGEVDAIDYAAKEMFVGITRPTVTRGMTDHSEHMGGDSAAESMDMGGEGAAGDGTVGEGSVEEGAAETDTAAAMSENEMPESAVQAAMLHGDQVSVVDSEGNFVRVYGNSAILSGELAKDIPALLAQYGP